MDIDHLGEWLVAFVPSAPRLKDAVSALGQILRGVPTPALPRVDVAARNWSKWDDSGYRGLTPADVTEMAAATGDRLAVAAMASMHRNGHVREAAVRMLAELSGGDELRWLLLRCTDWVPEVRVVAAEAVRDRCLTTSQSGRHAEQLADAVGLLDGERFTRPEVVPLRDELIEAVLASEARPALRAAAITDDHATRRAAIRLLAQVEPSAELLRQQLSQGDVVAARSVAEALLSDGQTCGEIAQMLTASKMARLRQLGLWHLLSHGHDAVAAVETALIDDSPAVRDLAQRRAGDVGIQIPAWYRDRAAGDPIGALRGLSDVGTADDLDFARAHLSSADTRTRASAVRLIARAGDRSDLADLTELAVTGSGRVAREALAGLRRLGVDADLAWTAWERALEPDVFPPGRRRTFQRLLPLASRWIAAEAALRALLRPEVDVQLLGVDLLARTRDTWNQSWTEPGVDQLERLTALLDQIPVRRLPRPLRDEYRDIAQSWRSSRT